MRIIQFPLYIKKEELRDYYLRDCCLIIDGHNFFYNSCKETMLFDFGIAADAYAVHLKKKLAMFKQAGVKCYVVFKGGDTDPNKKIKRVLSHEKEIAIRYPIFMKEIWTQVLEEEGIDYSTCVAESKDDCVALAHSLECSVLSNDIEYCFRNVLYIPLTTINDWLMVPFVICQQYNMKEFLKKHSLTENKFAIFAALSDVNVFTENEFDYLFRKWGVLNKKSLYSQHKSLLNWLAKRSEENILNEISKFLSSELNQRFLNYKQNVLGNMQHSNHTLVTDYLLNDRRFSVNLHDPMWFEKGVATQKIHIQYINLYKHKLIIISSKNLDQQIRIFMDIIIYAYNLLTNFTRNDITVYFEREGVSTIKINPDDFNLKKPTYQCIESVFENGWADIKSLKLFDHFLNENNINKDTIKNVPVEARMLFISLIYFAHKKTSANVDVLKEIYCFIISYVMLHIVFDQDDSVTKKISEINESDSAEAIRVTDKYFKCTPDEVIQIYDEDALKTLVELQYCLLQMNNLNSLCGHEYETTKYHRTINAIFIYKLLLRMRDFNENEFLTDLFQTAPSVLKFIKKLIYLLKENI